MIDKDYFIQKILDDRENYTTYKDTLNIVDEIFDTQNKALREAYKDILELLNNEMSGIDERALRDYTTKWLEENKETK